MKLYYYIFLVFIIFSKQTYADTYDLKKDYRLSIDLLGINLEIGTIDTYLEFKLIIN